MNTQKHTLSNLENTSLSDFETFLQSQVSETFDDPRSKLQDAMRWSLLNGGKRLRTRLCFATAQLINPDFPMQHLFPLAASIEMIHAYSLIHDDLPAMDNDALRRGKPACHIQFSEDLAILAGDTLNTLAFEILAHQLPQHFSDTQTLQTIRQLTQASGLHGMAGGQALDLIAEKQNIPSDVTLIHSLKTGALIKSAILIPTTLLSPSESLSNTLQSISQKIGLLYQIIDDILDVEGQVEQLGKTPQKDQNSHKITYISSFGLSKSKQLSEQLYTEARLLLDQIQQPSSQPLEQLLEIIYTRNH